MRIVELTAESRENILEELLKRSPNQYGEYEATVNEIIQQVRKEKENYRKISLINIYAQSINQIV